MCHDRSENSQVAALLTAFAEVEGPARISGAMTLEANDFDE
jgi:hypothetical protein